MLQPGSLIPQTFYSRPVAEVARELLGAILRREGVALRITEVEAYGGPEDSASHCRFGRTARNAPMWEAGGRAYVYFCYGMHHMLNLVTGQAGTGAAVLVRACEPVEGLERIRERRHGLSGPALLTGPGKVAQALALDRSFNDHPLFEPGGLELRAGEAPAAILAGPRVGVDFATEEDRGARLRFAAGGSRWITHPKGLRPLD